MLGLFRKKRKRRSLMDHPLPWFDCVLEDNIADYRGMPTRECVCGNALFLIVASFDYANTVSGYYLDGVCTYCGAIVSVPCEADPINPLERNDDM